MNGENLQLISRCKDGDRRAQEELYRLYSPMLMGVCLRYASNKEEAEDFLQEGFIKIYANLYQYQPIGSFSSWLKKVVVNVALQKLRRKKTPFADIEIDRLADAVESNEDIFSRFGAKMLIRLIQQLPDGYRTVFNMYVIEGYSHKEIATQLGINEATSKSQLSRAKAALRKMLEQVV
ncbi:MAG: RNA polymerase sigma factor [Saprospiraceae bacterium]